MGPTWAQLAYVECINVALSREGWGIVHAFQEGRPSSGKYMRSGGEGEQECLRLKSATDPTNGRLSARYITAFHLFNVSLEEERHAQMLFAGQLLHSVERLYLYHSFNLFYLRRESRGASSRRIWLMAVGEGGALKICGDNVDNRARLKSGS